MVSICGLPKFSTWISELGFFLDMYTPLKYSCLIRKSDHNTPLTLVSNHMSSRGVSASLGFEAQEELDNPKTLSLVIDIVCPRPVVNPPKQRTKNYHEKV